MAELLLLEKMSRGGGMDSALAAALMVIVCPKDVSHARLGIIESLRLYMELISVMLKERSRAPRITPSMPQCWASAAMAYEAHCGTSSAFLGMGSAALVCFFHLSLSAF